jgi:hypothetical protein
MCVAVAEAEDALEDWNQQRPKLVRAGLTHPPLEHLESSVDGESGKDVAHELVTGRDIARKSGCKRLVDLELECRGTLKD